MAVASLTEINKAVVASINAATAATWTATLDDDRRSTGEIQHAIVSADADVVLAILETPGHPQRAGYMAASADLTYDAGNSAPEIADSIGEYGPVEIKIASGDTVYVTGTPTTVDDIELIRRNPNSMFSPAHTVAASPNGGYYAIRHPKLHFTGSAARVWVGAFTPNYATPACFAPEQYTQAIVALAVARLMKEGDQPEVFAMNMQRGAYYLDLIRGKAAVLPLIEQTQKAVG